MFCDEPIKYVYESAWDGTDEEFDLDSAKPYDEDTVFFSYHFPELSCFIVPPSRLVLETESYYLQIDDSGVSKMEKTGPIELLEHPNEWLRSFLDDSFMDEEETPWDRYPHTLLAGERLNSVLINNQLYLLQFDDFALRVVILPTKQYINHLERHRNLMYYPVIGCEHLLKYRCDCGGEPEIIEDFVNDYEIRCKKCKRSIGAGMTVQDAIDNWNWQWENGKMDLHVFSLPSDNLQETFGKKLLSLSVDSKTSWWIEPYCCECQEILIQTEKQKILLEHAHYGEDGAILVGEPMSLNKENFKLRILSEENSPIVFDKAQYREDGTLEALRFRYGDSYLFVFADEDELILTKGTDDGDVFAPWVKDDDYLFNLTSTT